VTRGTVITKIRNLSTFDSGKLLAGPKGVVLVVDDLAEFETSFIRTGLATKLAKLGVALFAIAGVEAEAAHDALDSALESEGFNEVMTSLHDDDTADELAAFLETTAASSELSQLVVLCPLEAGYEADVLRHLRSG
jgi:hypothetical protein